MFNREYSSEGLIGSGVKEYVSMLLVVMNHWIVLRVGLKNGWVLKNLKLNPFELTPGILADIFAGLTPWRDEAVVDR